MRPLKNPPPKPAKPPTPPSVPKSAKVPGKAPACPPSVSIPVFGTSFSVYAPLITVLLSLATFFNWYGRLLAKLGVDHEDAVLFGGDAEEYEMRLREGKTLLARRLAAGWST